ncbi:DUF7342 family protein [Natronorubrum aibiense]|uniref:Uncharacterized protein n=1 Tax=Natronorubrum aibiense TaxID=348826 RepID=A0A5P9P2F0_9EURY|nr:helix-turn-helix domain-containing protein [Natronorubrum aibiense]QFU82298.1 hypothetical protein GCU68_07030 [Natronorubrum aibiense]
MGSGSSCKSPLIENPFTEDSIEARLYETIARMQSPSTVSEIAVRTDCEPQTVREYLKSFVSLGVVIEHRDTPPTYERNDAYFDWDTVKTLAREHSLAELEEHIQTLFEQIQLYQERYDAESPDDVTDATADSVKEDMTEWMVVRAELRRYEQARQIRLSKSDDCA